MKLEIIENDLSGHEQKETILFVHGAYHGAWCWKENFFPYFEKNGYKCYAVSLRGHGESEGREQINDFSIDDYVQDVVETIDSLECKPILIGHSMGGAVVQKAAFLHKDKIAGMVLLASVPPKGMLLSLLRLLVKNSKKAQVLMNYNPEKDYAMIGSLFFSEEMDKDEVEKYSKKMIAESALASRQTVSKIVSSNVLPENMPILIMGAKKDVMLTNGQIKRIGKFYHKDIIWLEKSGHDIMLDIEWKNAAETICAYLDNMIKKRTKK